VSAPKPKSPPSVRIRYPGSWPLRFGTLETGNVVHEVAAETAERLIKRGWAMADDAIPTSTPAIEE
jgi:hypothetical protein